MLNQNKDVDSDVRVRFDGCENEYDFSGPDYSPVPYIVLALMLVVASLAWAFGLGAI